MKYLLICIGASLVWACASVDTRTSLDAPPPSSSMAQRYEISLDVLETGHGVYMRKCGECHLHILPDEVSKEDWHVTLPGMAWNAGIEPEEEAALEVYLDAARREILRERAME